MEYRFCWAVSELLAGKTKDRKGKVIKKLTLLIMMCIMVFGITSLMVL